MSISAIPLVDLTCQSANLPCIGMIASAVLAFRQQRHHKANTFLQGWVLVQQQRERLQSSEDVFRGVDAVSAQDHLAAGGQIDEIGMVLRCVVLNEGADI